MANGPKFGKPRPPRRFKPAVHLNAKPTRPHRARKRELLDALRQRAIQECESIHDEEEAACFEPNAED